MKEINNIELDDEFNCEGGINVGKSKPASISKKKYDAFNVNEEDGSYVEPYFYDEIEIPYGYEWESYSETH